MSTRLIGRRMFQQSVGADTDQVCFGFWIPANSTVRGLSAYFKGLSTLPQTILTAGLGAASIWMLPVVDPDSGNSMETIWDTHVPKETTANTMDLDAATPDTQPAYEPGALAWEHTFDIGRQPRRLWHQEFMSTALDGIGLARDPETPFNYEFHPSFRLGMRLAKAVRVRQPSLLVAGFSSPDTTVTSPTTPIQAIGESDWGQLQFIDHVMERAMMSLLGLTEVGAETPWEEATQLLKQHLHPSVLELSGSTFLPLVYRVFGEATAVIDVQGSMPKNAIDLGGGRA